MEKKVAFLSLLVILAGCSNTFVKTGEGVIVKTGDHSRVRLEAVTDSIIRVSAVCSENFSTRTSLSVLPVKGKPRFSVTSSGDTVTLSTATLNAKVDRKSGRISFFDANGESILNEDRRKFTPIKTDGDKGYTVRQVFRSPADEAFYGLGQHQSDEFNYKGKNETLYQYNTKVSIPFIVSNKGYGILWDNYSLTRWGDPCDYAELDTVFTTGGFQATYTAADGTAIKRKENEIDYADLEKTANFPAGFADKFYGSTITWEGDITPSETGIYRFLLHYAGYTTLFVDGKVVVPEHWRTAWNPNNVKFQLDMTKGEARRIKIVWHPDGGISYISLKVLSPVDPDEQAKMSWWSEMGDQIDYYFIYGGNADGVISGYRKLTGKSQIMPEWAMGFWQSRERYQTQKELLSTVAEYRKRHLGLDVIVLDWFYWVEDSWGSHIFDRTRFPDPKVMVDSVHAMDAHLMISVWPKFYCTTEHYKELDKIGAIYRQAIKDSIHDWVGKSYIGSFYDAYNPKARKLYWHQISDCLLPLGIDAWWLDASEPDIQSNHSLEYRKKLCGPTYLGSSTRYLNAYALMNAEAVYEGQRSKLTDKRVVILTRSGFAGIQRYSTAIWSGDIGTCWEDMKAQISAGLNFSISGIPYWTQDIGGFSVQHKFEVAKEGSPDMDEWRELNTRWHQWGTFTPIYRSHGQYPCREIYNLAPESSPAYHSIAFYNKLRYRLMPYIYTLASRTWFDDYTIMRPLVMDFPSDTNVTNISDQYMFGDAFMVCPVYTFKARSRKVYLPSGGWYDFFTGKFLNGGQTINADAPYEHSPLYVRAGRIIPMGPDVEYASRQQEDPITINVYSGADASFSLYEDDGTTYGYERGEYSRIPMKWKEKDSVLEIGARKGSFDGMRKERKISVLIMRSDKTTETFKIDYKGEPVTIKCKTITNDSPQTQHSCIGFR
ncbi:MAG: DUF5110 domain-containing protein [Bacteroidales bacterium]|jgi:alpha-D-xyloside xylohydrolase|nr:DUF5110 domain-containing protein [Bacteroidales bacterium]MCI2122518.1 DUF5110 domain-containing protein [Bacteroidales bacterium]MCI2145385.1 DUF5110 domain-containing protein [Bacteroidales bacterium]